MHKAKVLIGNLSWSAQDTDSSCNWLILIHFLTCYFRLWVGFQQKLSVVLWPLAACQVNHFIWRNASVLVAPQKWTGQQARMKMLNTSQTHAALSQSGQELLWAEWLFSIWDSKSCSDFLMRGIASMRKTSFRMTWILWSCRMLSNVVECIHDATGKVNVANAKTLIVKNMLSQLFLALFEHHLFLLWSAARQMAFQNAKLATLPSTALDLLFPFSPATFWMTLTYLEFEQTCCQHFTHHMVC